MSKSKIRSDKTCLNCRHVVEKRFCSNCGQENTESRKTFHQLFIHFFEDLTHYENAFWKTIRNLILKPGALTKEYLSGKRLSYLAPVRLYIFISFITFLLLGSIFVSELKQSMSEPQLTEQGSDSIRLAKLDKLVADGILSESLAEKTRKQILDEANDADTSKINLGYKSVEELDYQYKNNTGDRKLTETQYKNLRKAVAITEKYTKAELGQKLIEELMHNFPKVLFIYMPMFAFFLWVAHNKRRWYYFDHGIFTLHYFSFLLLITLIMALFSWVVEFCGNPEALILVDGAVSVVGTIWMIYYFFPAHHRFYGGSRLSSFIKSVGLLLINIFFGSILMVALIIYSLLTIH